MKMADLGDRERVRGAKHPAEAKKLGASLPARPDWDQVKDEMMWDGARMKFQQNPILRDMLLATENAELVHFAPWGDSYWGVDRNMNGQNKHGKILMIVRKELR